jgi:ABC-type transport system substrate-binding protein
MCCLRFCACTLFSFLLFNSFPGYSQVIRETEKSGIAAEQPRSGGIYHIPLLNEPPTLDPAFVVDSYGMSVVQQIFDGLVQFSPDLFVTPGLAENWKVEDNGKLYRFFLRSKVRFHNGHPVTASDVVFSLSRLIRVSPPPTILPHLLKISGAQEFRENKNDQVTGFKVVDDRTLLVKLDEPYTPFLTALGLYQAKIVPKEEVERDGSAFGKKPIGTGPFQLVSWEAGRGIRLQQFANYFGGAPFLDQIFFSIYPGGNIEEVLSDFQNGKIEEMPVYGQIRQKLMENKNLRWLHRPSLSLLFYGINCEHPLLRNLKLRKALGAAIDRQRIATEVYRGQFEPVTTLLPPGMPGYQPQGKRWSLDRDLADSLAREVLGGNDKAPTIEVVSNSQSLLAQSELSMVREAWRRLGINMDTKFIPDWSQFEQYLKSDSLQIYRYAWYADIPDADNFLQPLFASDSQVNFMRYRDSAVEAIFREARGLPDPIERARLYQRIEGMVADSYPLIPLFYLGVDRVYQPYVRGVEVSALGEQAITYQRVWLTIPSEQ